MDGWIGVWLCVSGAHQPIRNARKFSMCSQHRFQMASDLASRSASSFVADSKVRALHSDDGVHIQLYNLPGARFMASGNLLDVMLVDTEMRSTTQPRYVGAFGAAA